MKVNWLELAMGVFGGLGVFLYGMRVMSRGLESVGGQRMRLWLQAMTNHPVAGVATGFFVTCVIQSSSATTVMLVSLVHAGFLNLTQAIGVIMGANIGTTLTGWIVALLGFKIKIAKFALPTIGFGVVLIFLGTGRKRGLWGEILVGFGLLFLGLMFMKEAAGILQKSPEITTWLHAYSAQSGLLAMLACIAIGTIVTIVIQSSSATMALTITLAQQGLIDFPTAAALVLGENIGTTITANLAAIGTTLTARRAAIAHFFFNIAGVIWAIILFQPLLLLVDKIVPGNALSKDVAARANAIGSHMAAFHTTFNIINTLLFLPLVTRLAALVTKVLPGQEDNESKHHILYLDSRVVSTPELALLATRKELQRMAQHAIEMFDHCLELFAQGGKSAKQLAEKIAHCEDVLDQLESGITEYLAEVSQNQLSNESSHEISDCMNMAHNFEKIGDHCESILRYLKRKYDNEIEFTEEAKQEIRDTAALVRQALQLLADNILNTQINIMEQAIAVEQKIDKARSELRDAHIERIVEGRCDAKSGLIFIDILTSFEKIGDHAFNVAQYISHKRD